MIKGIGNDIIEIERVKKAAEKDSFLKKVFSEEELAYFRQKNMRAETIAGNFAAKEAVAKAMGTGFSGFEPSDVAVLRNENGKPYVVLKGEAKEKAFSLGINKIEVSISHCRDYASAFAVCEGDDTL